MTIKCILVPLSEPRLVKTSLKAAMAVATRFAAHIDALHVRPDSRMVAASFMGDTMPGSMIEQIIEDTEKKSAENARKTRQAFDQFCKTAGIKYAEQPGRGTNALTAAWREEVGYEDQWLRTHGRISDLIVLPRPSGNMDVGVRLSLEAALMDTGRPLLMVPETFSTKVGNNIAIAWNGSTEAARAVGEARPLIENARKVTVLTAAEKDMDEDFDPEGLSRFLAWHGAKAAVMKVRPRGDVGKALLSAADKVGADLLVMGAYSHSRVREMILGGVTREVLTSAGIPVLMAH
jgi:nucleotide-binding universal stress UspA family protein